MNCPHCQSTHVTRNGSTRGKPRYRCSDCGKTFSTQPAKVGRTIALNNPPCIICNGRTVKDGKQAGKQRLRCRECNKKFTL